MKKFFVTNLIFLLALNLLIKTFWILGIDRSVQNALPMGEYGVYFALLNFTYLFNILLDLGINSFNNKTIAQNTSVLKKYFARILPLKLCLSGVYIVLLFCVSFIVDYDSYARFLLFWLAIFQILTSLLTYLRSNISALLLFKTDSVLSVLDKALTILFCSCLLWTSWGKKVFCVEYFVYAQVLSLAISTLVALFICLEKTGFISLVWNFSFMKAVLKYGFPFALLTLLMSLYNRIDSVMLERILKDNGVASEVYASGFRLVDSVNMVAYLFSVILLPLFAKMIKDKINIEEITKISFHLLLFISLSFALLGFFYSYEIVDYLYTKHVSDSAEVFKILCFCFIPVSMTYIFGTLLTANGSLKKLNIVAFCGMILNIATNFLLIPYFKEIGSAFAALISQSITAILQIIIAVKIFQLKINKNYVFRLLCFVICMVLCSFAVYKIDIVWTIRLCISIVLFCALSLVFRLFNIKEIISLIPIQAKKKE
ncbi:MAG: polysaccharide biosynthesis C-terminal domain-containing protein [Bacteroidales bacterium]|nr:polysaccharide biosynthesis C-terminal domain-containing protein [Bacteroidales bacterium]